MSQILHSDFDTSFCTHSSLLISCKLLTLPLEDLSEPSPPLRLCSFHQSCQSWRAMCPKSPSDISTGWTNNLEEYLDIMGMLKENLSVLVRMAGTHSALHSPSYSKEFWQLMFRHSPLFKPHWLSLSKTFLKNHIRNYPWSKRSMALPFNRLLILFAMDVLFFVNYPMQVLLRKAEQNLFKQVNRS